MREPKFIDWDKVGATRGSVESPKLSDAAGCGVPTAEGGEEWKTAEVTHLENEPAAKVDTSNFGRAVREAGVDGVVTKHDSGEKSDEDRGRGEGGSQGDHGWRERG